MSLISIIVPIYNTERYLDRCLTSIMNQTYSLLDIILVDDGSTDGSTKISEQYISKDSRFRLIKQKNMGASVARNSGLNAAKGDYIMFVDSDDWVAPYMVEALINDIQDHEVDMVISQVPLDKQFSKNMMIGKMEALPILLEGTWWSPYGKIIKKAIIENVRFPKATISEDYVFMLHTILNSNHIYYDSRCFYHREIRKGSLSRLSLSERKFEEYDNVSYVADFIRKNYPQYRQLAEARMAETSLKLLFAIHESKQQSNFSNQRKMLNTSIRNNITKYLPNHNILLKSRLLLLMCTTSWGSKLAHCFYSKYN